MITRVRCRRNFVLCPKTANHVARAARCERLFVRSDRRRTESHDFYRMLGFDEVNLTFDLPLDK